MKSEVWALIKIFVVVPVGAALAWHGAVYIATGKTPHISWSSGESECGTGQLKYDC